MICFFLRPHALAGDNPYLGGDYQLAIHPRAESGNAKFPCFSLPGLEPVLLGQESNTVTIRPSALRLCYIATAVTFHRFNEKDRCGVFTVLKCDWSYRFACLMLLLAMQDHPDGYPP